MESAIPQLYPILIEERAGRGRCMVAAKDLPAGSLVFTCAAAAAFPSSDTRCMQCWKTAAPGEELLRCAPCKTAYCSKECQRADWKEGHHKRECPLLRGFKIRDSPVPVAQWVTLLLAARMYRTCPPGGEGGGGGGGGTAAVAAPPSGAPFPAALADVHSLRVAPGADVAHAETVVALGRQLDVFPPAAVLPDARARADVEAFESNNFSVTDETLEVAGCGVYPAAALLNHSCAPNTVLSFGFVADPALPPTTLLVRTLVPVRAGEELTHAYCDATKPVEERRAELRAVYSFLCSCPACALGGAPSGAAVHACARLFSPPPPPLFPFRPTRAGEAEAAAAAAAAAAADPPPPPAGVDGERVARASLMLSEARAIAAEPELPISPAIFAAMAAEGARPAAEPIPPSVAAAWQSDPSFAARVLRLELAVLTHGVRTLRAAGAPPFRDDIMRAVHAVLATAPPAGDFALAEAACRHLLADLRGRAAFAHTVPGGGAGGGAGAAGGGRPTAPLYALQLVPLADIYAQWARAGEVSAAVATPGVGQAAAARGRGAGALPPAPLPREALEEREAAAGAFFCPPGPGGGGDPLGVGQAELSSKDLRAAAAALFGVAAEGAAAAFGPRAPHAERLRHMAAALSK